MLQLTQRETEILKALTEDFLTPSKVSLRLKISKVAVYKHIKKLRLKGYLNGSSYKGFTNAMVSVKGGFTDVPTFPVEGPYLRLHGREYHLTLKKEYLKKQAPKFLWGTKLYVYKTTARLFQADRHIYAKTTEELKDLSDRFFNAIFNYIEDRLNIPIGNVTISHIGHIAEVNSEFAKAAEAKQSKIYIKAPEDGKVWLITDKSLNRNETETTHSKTSLKDSALVFDRVFNAYRSGTALEPLEVTEAIGRLAIIQEKTQQQLLYYAENNAAHSDLLINATLAIKELSKAAKIRTPQYKRSQRRLTEY